MLVHAEMVGRDLRWGLKVALLDSALFLGPAMFIVVQMSGKGFSNYFAVGHDLGLFIFLFIGLSLIFRFAIVDGLARYTVSRGESVFSALPRLPGPKNWGVWTVIAVYVLEVVNYSLIALAAAAVLDSLTPGDQSERFLAVAFLLVALVFLQVRSFKLLEKFVYLLISTVGIILLYCTLSALMGGTTGPISSNVPLYDLEPDLMLVMGSGSGLSLLLYSVWIGDKLQKAPQTEGLDKMVRNIRASLATAFTLTGLIALAIVIVAWNSGSDGYLSVQATALGSLPYAAPAFVLSIFLLFFGVMLVGIDGRARAITRMLHQTKTTSLDRKILYRALVLFYVILISASLWLGTPSNLLGFISAVSSALFALSGFTLIYLNWKMPAQARAGLVWSAVALVGSSLILIIALLKEETMLAFGVPILIRVGAVSLLLYLLLRLGVLPWMVRNVHRWKGAAACLLLFSAISILGTTGGIEYDGVIINYRDLGPMMAGLLGGPVIGGLVGLVGGSYRYGLGGWSAVPCFVATVSGGIVAGLLSWYWKGRISYLKVSFVAILVEVMHLFLYLPLLSMDYPWSDVVTVMTSTAVPMTITNMLGLIAFKYVLGLRSVRPQPSVAAVGSKDGEGQREME